MTPSTADELAERMEQFELVSRTALDDVWTELGGHNVPLAEFGAAVVRRELLTRYQLDRLLRGEHEGFFYGRAKILYQVGAGSFSRVYRAIHADTGRVLAVKVLRNRFASDPEKGKSFQREGEMGKRLRHPNIVKIEEVGRENNTSYITMEFVEGQTLRELVRVRGAIDLPRALSIIKQVVDGLEYAHGQGVTHRDLKASNVLVGFTGDAKLVDFGLAGGDTAGSRQLRKMEQPRTVDYATLESIAGVKDDSVRSDIYFLGTLAYLALSGASALVESRDRTVRTDPRRYTGVEPLAMRAPHLPRDVVDFVSRMMHLDPRERFQTMRDVSRALEPLVEKYAQGGAEAEAVAVAAAPAAGPPAARTPAGPGKARAAEPAPAVAPARDAKPAGPVTRGTIMLVEAVPNENSPVRVFFKELGYRVLFTENLQRALVRCASTPRAADCLVISGLSLGQPGVEVFNSLAAHEELRDVPALLVVDPNQQQLAAQAKADARRKVVLRPLQPAGVGALLDSLIKGRG
jgi:eukaryotic-like serine/threonine-protein kinase